MVSLTRLYIMRAAYLLITVGLATMIWPLLLNPDGHPEHMQGVVRAMLGAVALGGALGIRYPLQMLPVLFFELAWKAIWLVAVAMPMRADGPLPPPVQSSWFECLFGVIVCLIAIPWGYVYRNYAVRPGDRWRAAP